MTDKSFKDNMYYRYAETLLLGAEAHWHVSGDNHDATALNYINQIRKRAGVPDFTEFTLDSYLEESARELVMMAVIYLAGVTSKAGLATSTPSGVI